MAARPLGQAEGWRRQRTGRRGGRGAEFNIAAMSNLSVDDFSAREPLPAARIRVVLVGTQHPGNIGSAARAMKTMGLAALASGAPASYQPDSAARLAGGGSGTAH